ncbi:MAG: phytoene desaturase family protein [Patescibacteria group bacterium]|nr:phytoene desaturase family protein [Patescibacteria group bacterium]
MSKKVAIIGAGFGGLSAAAYLSRDGYDVTVFEKNDQPGGRAIIEKHKGFVFDMGPSWYMMPDVFDDYFADFGYKTRDFYKLVQLKPAYRVYNQNSKFDVSSVKDNGLENLEKLFPGVKQGLEKYLDITGKEYRYIREHLLEKDYLKTGHTLNTKTFRMLGKPERLRSYHYRVNKYVKNQDAQKILEFMTVFMGGSPQNIPGIYSLLGYVDMELGIWYPMGGFGEVVRQFENLAKDQGAKFVYSAEVDKIITNSNKATGISVNGKTINFDIVVANGDYHHIEQDLLPANKRSYTESYWQKRTLSPSAVLAYLGVDKKVTGLLHHTMFFDADWYGHFDKVFEHTEWSENPLFYVGTPSKTDPIVAPGGNENIIILAPMANGLNPTKKQKEDLIDSLIKRMENKINCKFSNNIVYKKIIDQDYFESSFNSYRGNAFGLAHSLRQSAVFRPRMQSKKLSNLFYVGQYTNPGTGVPMVVLSGKIIAKVVGERNHR